MNDTNLLNKSADNIRVLTAAMVEKPNRVTPEVLWGELILSMCYIPSFSVRSGGSEMDKS